MSIYTVYTNPYFIGVLINLRVRTNKQKRNPKVQKPKSKNRRSVKKPCIAMFRKKHIVHHPLLREWSVMSNNIYMHYRNEL